MAEIRLTDGSIIEVELYPISYIPGYKQAEEERRENEKIRISNEEKREDYYEEIQRKVDNGEFKGDPNVLTIGTVEKGDEAEATITGDSPNQILNLVLPKGDKGEKGDTPDMSIYYTKTEVNDLLSKYYTETEIDTLMKNYYTGAEVDNIVKDYYTKAEIDSIIGAINTELSTLTTISEVV